MALHYFHLFDGHAILDEVGTNHPDPISVRKYAVRAFRELLHLGSNDSLWTGGPWRVWVTDQPDGMGRTVLTLELKARVVPESDHRSCECGALYDRSEAMAPERQVAAFERSLCGTTLESWNSTSVPTYRFLAGPVRMPER